ncbi:MAG: hypothetical protein U0547_01000 [Dehalococcoidia bacterium]
MSIVMMMQWPGVTLDEYEKVRAIVRFDVEPPVGGAFHVAAADAAGLRVIDVWDSAEQFQAFVDARLMPAVQQVGISAEPQIEILPVHFAFAPALMARA